jgi:hypothetical protein
MKLAKVFASSLRLWKVCEQKEMNSVKIVEEFWAAVWKARNPDAIDKYMVDDFVITTGGIDIHTKDRFKEWVQQFLDKMISSSRLWRHSRRTRTAVASPRACA